MAAVHKDSGSTQDNTGHYHPLTIVMRDIDVLLC